MSDTSIGGSAQPPTQGSLPGVSSANCSSPNAESILGWISAAAGKPWFPSAQAKVAGLSRESFDEPLNELRIAGLIRIEAWVRGEGQSYVLTPEGITATTTAASPSLSDTLVNEVATGSCQPLPDGDEIAAAQSEDNPVALDIHLPLIVPAMLLICLLCYFVGMVMAARSGVSLFGYLEGSAVGISHRLGAVSINDLAYGGWWRVAANSFVHLGAWHLILNLFGLGVSGAVAEMLWGSRRVLLIVILSSVSGTCVSLVISSNDSDIGNGSTIQCGASSSVWGLLGSVLAAAVINRESLAMEVSPAWSRRLSIIILLFVGSNILPGALPILDLVSQMSGLVMGFLATGLLNVVSQGERGRKITALGFLLFLPSFCLAILYCTVRGLV